jgi:hypothetical protein
MKKPLALLALVLLTTATQAQFIADTNKSVSVSSGNHIKTLGKISGLSYFDGQMRVCISGMTFSATSSDASISELKIDAGAQKVDRNITYITKNPVTGNVFYTKDNGKGHTELYELKPAGGGRFSAEQIKMRKYQGSISHPTFSPDGCIMIFSTNDMPGQGGGDLWYSEYRGGKWQTPHCFDVGINTKGNEITPCIAGRYLYFASDNNSYGYKIYVTRLLREEKSTDKGSVLLLRHGRTMRLPAPVNSGDADYGLIVDEATQQLFWIHNDGVDEQLMSASGRLDCVVLEGNLTDYADDMRRLSGGSVEVALADNPRKILYRVYSDDDGHYRVYLQPEREYALTFVARGYMAETRTLRPRRNDENQLVNVMPYSIGLQVARYDKQYTYSGIDIFGADASSDIADGAQGFLDPIVRILADSPRLKVNITAKRTRGDNVSFNQLLCNARLEELIQYFVVSGIDAGRITTDIVAEQGTAKKGRRTSSQPSEAESDVIQFTFIE